MAAKKELDIIANYLNDSSLCEFILDNFRESLEKLGHSTSLIEDLLTTLRNLKVSDYSEFRERHIKEIEEVYVENYFQKLAILYFAENFIPFLPPAKKVLELGCGTGLLACELSKSEKFNQIIGIDIESNPLWQKHKNPKLSLEIIPEAKFAEFLRSYQPDLTTMTWVLHHMQFEEQERYIKNLYNLLPNHAQIVILEDTYSEKQTPKFRPDKLEEFLKWNPEQRHIIMALNDWVANRILSGRKNEPIPFTYRTIEQWKELFEEKGFKPTFVEFIGYPSNHDVNCPQCVLGFIKND